MAWIQPFFNWVAGMIPTKDDFNRIEGNIQVLKDEITTQTADLEQNKVDKVAGKGLSANDYTTEEKIKLGGISKQATKVEQSVINGNIKNDGVEMQVYRHPGSGTNPHGTTKSDVGLGSVQNYGIATKAEAEAGTSDIKYMTPLRVKEAIDKNTSPALPGDTNVILNMLNTVQITKGGYNRLIATLYLKRAGRYRIRWEWKRDNTATLFFSTYNGSCIVVPEESGTPAVGVWESRVIDTEIAVPQNSIIKLLMRFGYTGDDNLHGYVRNLKVSYNIGEQNESYVLQ